MVSWSVLGRLNDLAVIAALLVPRRLLEVPLVDLDHRPLLQRIVLVEANRRVPVRALMARFDEIAQLIVVFMSM